MSISVFLADDHKLMVEGLKSTLSRFGVKVIDEAYTLDSLAERFLNSGAEVMVIDVRFEGCGTNTGLDICEDILKKNKNAKIVVFSQFDDEWIVEKTYKMGVLSFVRKDEDATVLAQAVKAAHEGRDYFSPVVAQLLALTVVKTENPSRILDDKQLRVFTLTADGLSPAEVAEKMGLSYKTATTLLKDVKEKLGIDAVADFTKLAIKYGLTDLEVKTKK